MKIIDWLFCIVLLTVSAAVAFGIGYAVAEHKFKVVELQPAAVNGNLVHFTIDATEYDDGLHSVLVKPIKVK